MAGGLISNSAASSPTVASPFASRARIARRVGSARAANVTERVVEGLHFALQLINLLE